MVGTGGRPETGNSGAADSTFLLHSLTCTPGGRGGANDYDAWVLASFPLFKRPSETNSRMNWEKKVLGKKRTAVVTTRGKNRDGG